MNVGNSCRKNSFEVKGGLIGISYFRISAGDSREMALSSSADSNVPLQGAVRNESSPPGACHVGRLEQASLCAGVPPHPDGHRDSGPDSVIDRHTAHCSMMPLIVRQ